MRNNTGELTNKCLDSSFPDYSNIILFLSMEKYIRKYIVFDCFLSSRKLIHYSLRSTETTAVLGGRTCTVSSVDNRVCWTKVSPLSFEEKLSQNLQNRHYQDRGLLVL